MEKKKILIAEDNRSNFMLVNFVLSKNYEIVWAQNGKEAVDKFCSEKPDLILMDVGMPVMDGFEPTRQIRKYSTGVPVIGLTAYAYSSDEEKGLESGMDKYLTKPLDMHLLKEYIRELIG